MLLGTTWPTWLHPVRPLKLIRLSLSGPLLCCSLVIQMSPEDRLPSMHTAASAFPKLQTTGGCRAPCPWLHGRPPAALRLPENPNMPPRQPENKLPLAACITA